MRKSGETERWNERGDGEEEKQRDEEKKSE